MLDVLLYREGTRRPWFYRVEIAMNLFAEASVIVEWGLMGGTPCRRVSCHSDLRAASQAADSYRNRALRRGYIRS
ncbi:WGR domain-containing protein [uncultured Tateyamaria sp.]|uniref:WGR domain-containing protein n=1 Tax=uncultured Tateyamaria sp. TaxID=455651 RepID=UPI0026131A28|nr:WGR domain-containing protein [uncultured Tateyamaria sp.]